MDEPGLVVVLDLEEMFRKACKERNITFSVAWFEFVDDQKERLIKLWEKRINRFLDKQRESTK